MSRRLALFNGGGRNPLALSKSPHGTFPLLAGGRSHHVTECRVRTCTNLQENHPLPQRPVRANVAHHVRGSTDYITTTAHERAVLPGGAHRARRSHKRLRGTSGPSPRTEPPNPYSMRSPLSGSKSYTINVDSLAARSAPTTLKWTGWVSALVTSEIRQADVFVTDLLDLMNRRPRFTRNRRDIKVTDYRAMVGPLHETSSRVVLSLNHDRLSRSAGGVQAAPDGTAAGPAYRP
jgi:hypothetical protein